MKRLRDVLWVETDDSGVRYPPSVAGQIRQKQVWQPFDLPIYKSVLEVEALYNVDGDVRRTPEGDGANGGVGAL